MNAKEAHAVALDVYNASQKKKEEAQRKYIENGLPIAVNIIKQKVEEAAKSGSFVMTFKIDDIADVCRAYNHWDAAEVLYEFDKLGYQTSTQWRAPGYVYMVDWSNAKEVKEEQKDVQPHQKWYNRIK